MKQQLLKPSYAQSEFPDFELEKKLKRKVFILSIAFLLLLAAFGTAQNMVSSLFKQMNLASLGSTMLFTLYLFFTLSSLLSSRLVKGKEHKITFLYSSLGLNTFVLFGLVLNFCDLSDISIYMKIVIYVLGCLVASICGMAAGALWICQGDYMFQVIKEKMEYKDELIPTFWAIYQCFNIVGNGMSYFLLSYSTQFFFIILMAIGLASSYIFYFCLPLPGEQSDKPSAVDLQQDEISLFQQLAQMYYLFQDKQCKKFMANTFSVGCFYGFVIGFIGKQVKVSYESWLLGEGFDPVLDYNNNYLNQLISFCFVMLGVTSYVAGRMTKQFTEKFQIYSLIKGGNILGTVALLLSLHLYFSASYLLCVIVASIMGFHYCFNCSIQQSLSAKDYPDIIEIYSLVRCMLSLGTSFMFLCQIYLDNLQLITVAFFIQFISFIMILNIGAPNLDKFLQKIKQPKQSFRQTYIEQDLMQCIKNSKISQIG